MQQLYSDKVIEHYENPKNIGSLDENDPHVGTKEWSVRLRAVMCCDYKLKSITKALLKM